MGNRSVRGTVVKYRGLYYVLLDDYLKGIIVASDPFAYNSIKNANVADFIEVASGRAVPREIIELYEFAEPMEVEVPVRFEDRKERAGGRILVPMRGLPLDLKKFVYDSVEFFPSEVYFKDARVDLSEYPDVVIEYAFDNVHQGLWEFRRRLESIFISMTGLDRDDAEKFLAPFIRRVEEAFKKKYPYAWW